MEARSPAVDGTDLWLQLGSLKTKEPWTSLNLGKGRMILVVMLNVCVLLMCTTIQGVPGAQSGRPYKEPLPGSERYDGGE